MVQAHVKQAAGLSTDYPEQQELQTVSPCSLGPSGTDAPPATLVQPWADQLMPPNLPQSWPAACSSAQGHSPLLAHGLVPFSHQELGSLTGFHTDPPREPKQDPEVQGSPH